MQNTSPAPFVANRFAFTKSCHDQEAYDHLTNLRVIYGDLQSHALILMRYLSERIKSHNSFWEEPYCEYMDEVGTETIELRNSLISAYDLAVRRLEFVLHAPWDRWLSAWRIGQLRSERSEFEDLIRTCEAFGQIRRQLREFLDGRAVDHHYATCAADVGYADDVGSYFEDFRKELWPQMRSAFRLLRRAITTFQQAPPSSRPDWLERWRYG